MIYLALVLVFVLLLVRLYVLRGKYTRERFAFRSFSFIAILYSTLIAQIISGSSFVYVFDSEILSLFLSGDKAVNSWQNVLLSLLMPSPLIFMATRYHSNWHGKESIRSHNNSEYKISTSILVDAFDYIRLQSSNELEEYIGNKDSLVSIHNEQIAAEDWHIEAIKLLKILSAQYIIDEYGGWYSEYSTYVGSYGDTSKILLFHCPSCVVDESEIVKPSALAKKLGISNFDYYLMPSDTAEIRVKESDIANFHPSYVIFSKEYILDKIADFNGYRNYIRSQYSQVLTSGADFLTIEQTYTPIRGRIDSEDREICIDDYVDDWLLEKGKKHLAILGEYGQGKSTYCLQLANRMLQKIDSGEKGSRLPVVIELRGKSPRTLEIKELLYTWCEKYGVSTEALLALHRNGRILLIFDGFDEMDFVGEPEIRIDHFRKLWKFAAYENSKIIITGRPNFFLDSDELNRSLLVSCLASDTPFCVPIRIQKFNAAEIMLALRNFKPSVKQSIEVVLGQMKKNAQLIDLLSRPSTLVWAASVWDQLKDDIHSVGASSVIGKFIEQSFSRQLSKQTTTMVYNVEREYFTCGIALALHIDNPGVNQISTDNLRRTTRRLIDYLPNALEMFASTLEPRYKPFSERIIDPVRRIETIFTDIRTCSVIVEDLSRQGYFKFAHKSFYEYFVGFYISHLFLSEIKADLRLDASDKGVIMFRAIYESSAKLGMILQIPLSEEVLQLSAQILADSIKRGSFQFTGMNLLRFIFPTRLSRLAAIWVISNPMGRTYRKMLKIAGSRNDKFPVDIYTRILASLLDVRLRLWAYLCIEVIGSVDDVRELTDESIWQLIGMKNS